MFTFSRYQINRLLRFLYQITFLILLLNSLDDVSGISVLRKIKYIYLIALAFYFVMNFHGRIKKSILYSCEFLGLILLHTLLFGVVIVNNSLSMYIQVHMRELLVMLWFILGTIVLYNDVIEKPVIAFCLDSFVIYTIYFLFAGSTHFSQFVNPLKFAYTFVGDHSYRVSFGAKNANYFGSYCCCMFIISIILLDYYRKNNDCIYLLHNQKVLGILLIDLIVWEMLFSASSRTAIYASVTSWIVYIWFNMGQLVGIRKNSRLIRYVLVIIGLVVLMAAIKGGVIEAILNNSRRDNGWAVNYPVFSNNYSHFTGMGYINYSGFSTEAQWFEYPTWNVDNYYLYILFTTGYFGAMIIAAAVLVALFHMIKYCVTYGNICGVCTIIALLMLGIAQSSVVSYDHIMSMTFWILIGLFCNNYKKV